MEIKRLSDDQLMLSAEQQFAIERKTSHYILLHLKEISLRRVYAKRGFPNLREMLIKHFRQSETAASQRLKALELMLDVPAVEERLISGDLNMSTVAMAQRQINREEKLTGQEISKEKKTEIVESITNKTMAKAEIELFKLLPETASHPETYERRVSEHATRLNFTVPNDVMEMLIRLKEIWAHIDPTMDHVEVIRRSFKMTLQKVDPAQRKASIKKSSVGSNPRINVDTSTNIDTDTNINSSTNINLKTNIDARSNVDMQTSMDSRIRDSVQRASTSSTQSLTHSVKHRGTKRPTYYKREVDRALWERAESQCEFIDEQTGRRCSCRFGLQREHVIPLALGGRNDLSNMQLLCATHNQLRARHVFGNKKIDAFQTKRRKFAPEPMT
jgi:5-methylcytosine-specific restriction endonuclease McrA